MDSSINKKNISNKYVGTEKKDHICVKINDPNFKAMNEMHVHTPTSDIAYTGCIGCIEMNMEYIDNLPDIPREGYRLSKKKSAQQFVLECISHGGFEENNENKENIKYKALIHFLKKGFPPCFQIFEFTSFFDKEQLIELASLGAYPIHDCLELYIKNKKFDEIKAVYEIIKDKTNIHSQIKDHYKTVIENK